MSNIAFMPVKLSDRKPDFTKRIFFYNSRTEDGFISEYIPNQEIEMKKGKLVKTIKAQCDRILTELKKL